VRTALPLRVLSRHAGSDLRPPASTQARRTRTHRASRSQESRPDGNSPRGQERGAPAWDCAIRRRQRAVHVLAHEVEHVPTDDFGSAFGDRSRFAACRPDCNSRREPGPDLCGSPRRWHLGRRRQWLRVQGDGRAISRSNVVAARPTAAVSIPARGTRRPPADLLRARGTRGSLPDIVQRSPGLTKVWSKMARHSCGPSTSVRWKASIFPARRFPHEPGVFEAGLPSPASRVGVGGRRRSRSFALPGPHHPEVWILVEEILKVGRSRPGQAREEDGAIDRREPSTPGSSATYRSTSMRFRRATASIPTAISTPESVSSASPFMQPTTAARLSSKWVGSGSWTSVSAWARCHDSFHGQLRHVTDLSIGNVWGKIVSGQTKRASPRISTLALVGTPVGHVGSVKALWGTRIERRRSVSCALNTSTSSGVMSW
jgi:hypothetical protein